MARRSLEQRHAIERRFVGLDQIRQQGARCIAFEFSQISAAVVTITHSDTSSSPAIVSVTHFVVVASHLVVPCVVGVARGGASCCNASCNAKRSRHARVLHAPEQNRELERCSV
ncbi:hypothetical protein IVB36_06440 [Bradyrhizobium sp. 35]|uniref:hypothetical protein n=1 Tax=Bradyrhizobium sp. 35 TaxID=2782670 RepID=UPI001FF791B6|nr:hypothetical protein [Bradyrhizobium sp. 35]MCK1450532.1 hypothetical protein [Bradyrhizobium sp. 35]